MEEEYRLWQELKRISSLIETEVEELINGENTVAEKELEDAYLYGKIENYETADFILSLISNLSSMEEELVAYGLLK